jgi:hypothetical protein
MPGRVFVEDGLPRPPASFTGPGLPPGLPPGLIGNVLHVPPLLFVKNTINRMIPIRNSPPTTPSTHAVVLEHFCPVGGLGGKSALFVKSLILYVRYAYCIILI